MTVHFLLLFSFTLCLSFCPPYWGLFLCLVIVALALNPTIIKLHKSYKAEYKYIKDMCQQEKPTGVTLTHNSKNTSPFYFDAPILGV